MLTKPRKLPLISVILPAYNECEALPVVIARVSAFLAAEDVDVEIIVVDDGSTDGTRQTILPLCGEQRGLRYVRFSRNFGKEAALTAGLDTARGDAVLLMDADGQHPVELVKEMLSRWRAGAEVVCGVQTDIREPFLKQHGRRWYYRVLGAGSSVTIAPNAGDFRLLDRKAVDAIKRLPERNRLMKGLYAWVGFRTEYIPFVAAPRVAGATKFNWLRLFGLGFTGLTSFTTIPLRLISVAGILVSLVSLLYGVYVLWEHYVEGHPAGYATIVAGMMFLSGLQLMALGIIAEYLGRTFEEVKQRPLYIVAEDTRDATMVRPATVEVTAKGEAAQGYDEINE